MESGITCLTFGDSMNYYLLACCSGRIYTSSTHRYTYNTQIYRPSTQIPVTSTTPVRTPLPTLSTPTLDEQNATPFPKPTSLPLPFLNLSSPSSASPLTYLCMYVSSMCAYMYQYHVYTLVCIEFWASIPPTPSQ